jgi:hypothetical protein
MMAQRLVTRRHFHMATVAREKGGIFSWFKPKAAQEEPTKEPAEEEIKEVTKEGKLQEILQQFTQETDCDFKDNLELKFKVQIPS